ncbi:unnamed protein product [Ambrosiozyma monospora]|uniref:Unnamed protein product n=1 Tax=Ambrosiozyma monospora TaxID=43982 RepID=A0ACB5SW81_AMBMO|nr:unnamed protein product [Ambrosiozyma monospora]
MESKIAKRGKKKNSKKSNSKSSNSKSISKSSSPEIPDSSSSKTTSSTSKNTSDSSISKLHNKEKSDELDSPKSTKVEDAKADDSEDTTGKSKINWKSHLTTTTKYLLPILITIIGSYLRYYKLDSQKQIVWDEAHFAKFGAYYVRHEFYHDVHPPLGKMLIGLSEYLWGNVISDNEFMFESGKMYPKTINYAAMRTVQCVFSSAMVLVCSLTAQLIGFKNWFWSSLLVSMLCCFENSFIVLGKFVLLDSMLLFFTATTFYCLVKLHSLRHQEFTRTWKLWMYLTGFSIGCVCSVKWVGLFVTAVVGVYVVVDLWLKFWDFVSRSISRCCTSQVMDHHQCQHYSKPIY